MYGPVWGIHEWGVEGCLVYAVWSVRAEPRGAPVALTTVPSRSRSSSIILTTSIKVIVIANCYYDDSCWH